MKLGRNVFMRGSENWLGFFSGKITAKQAVTEGYLKKISAEAKKEMTVIREEVKKEYDGYAKGWRHKPTFVVTVKSSPTEGGNERNELIARTTKDEAGEIFGYVDKGTPMHRIPSTGSKRMPMRVYKPRTQAGTGKSLGGGGTYKGGKPNIRTVVLRHSIAARNFTQKSREYWRKEFPRRMKHVARQAFRRKTR